ncbi:MAG TPA: LytTR family DNA-binding domain-containing protein [Burkholderiaceae bacterium]
MNILIVDDEPLARARLRTLLADCPEAADCAIAEAGNAGEAMARLCPTPALLVLLDIHMPGQDGLQLAQTLRALRPEPAIVFVTAHAEHAVQAFELEAADYLTKPVRLERLQQALAKARRQLAPQADQGNSLLIQYRSQVERVPLAEVLYCKAELKYVTVYTAAHSYVWDGTLNDLEARHADRLLRIHRNTLVSRQALRALEKHYDIEEGEGWAVRLHGFAKPLTVSRRQLTAVREAIAAR